MIYSNIKFVYTFTFNKYNLYGNYIHVNLSNFLSNLETISPTLILLNNVFSLLGTKILIWLTKIR